METTARTKDNVSNMHSKMEHGTSNNNIPLSPAQSTIFSISQCSTTTIAIRIAVSTGVAADPDKTFDKEGRLELGSDDTDSPATSNSPRESLRGGTLLGLELRRLLDGVDLDTVTLSMGNIKGFNNAPISIDDGELLSSYHFNRKDWSRVLTTVTSWQYRMTCTINNKEKDNSNNKQEGKQQ